MMPSAPEFDALRTSFRNAGAVVLRGALDAAGMAAAERAFTWSLENPGPHARDVLAGRPGAFYQDHANSAASQRHCALLRDHGLADLVARVIDSGSLWFLYEQIWLKDRGDCRRTPWHQDLPYIPVSGDHLVTLWINLDGVPAENSLEFIPGSHRGPLYNPTAFDPDDPAAAMYADGTWPPLPDIEQDRAAWPIISWAVEPGDVVLFHMATLHGGAPTGAGQRRRTISLRCFGEHAFCAERPDRDRADGDQAGQANGGGDPIEQMARIPAGSLFRHPGFPRVR